MDQLKTLKEQFLAQVQGQMGNLAKVDTKEMGEVIDIIKDLSEASYYCAVTEAMKEAKEDKEKYPQMYYTPYLPYEKSYVHNPYIDRDMDIREGRRYYGEGMPDSQGGVRNYSRETYPMAIRDYREGRSPMVRKNYMESKELHMDKSKQMKELEEYMKELSTDISEMIEIATPEEKQILKQKLAQLMGIIA